MRLAPELFEKIQSGKLFGPNAPNVRVTVEPRWYLKKTPSAYGNAIRGPYRYYTDGNTSTQEYEIPAIKTVSINRTLDQDIATCNITMYNMWHEVNTLQPELAGQLGKPGFFWPKRGQGDSAETWSQQPGTGAYRKDGSWIFDFSWNNVLVEDALIRVYGGYGGNPRTGNYKSIDENIEDGDIVLMGVFLVDTVNAGSDGMLTMSCRDMLRLLVDQIVFPPLIPTSLYPLEYTPGGKSPFDSFWGPNVRAQGTLPASKGEVRLTPYAQSLSPGADTYMQRHVIQHATDGDEKTFALTEAFRTSNRDTSEDNVAFFEFSAGNTPISSIKLVPWAGNYEVYVSVMVGNTWQGVANIPNTSGNKQVPYINRFHAPPAVPDGREQAVEVRLRSAADERSSAAHYNVNRIRISFKRMYFSNMPAPDGDQYRAGIRELYAFRAGANVSPYSPNFSATPWTFTMASHPSRGYWVCDTSGNVYGFGDAADYDSTGFGQVPIGSFSNNKAVDMAAHPSGKGYWVLDWRGHVWAYGTATDYGEHVIADPHVPLGTVLKKQAVSIAATHTGNGYWVAYSDGNIRGFGDATPTNVNIPTTQVATFMEAFLPANYKPGRYWPYMRTQKCSYIASHPHKMGFIAVDGSGQSFAYGAMKNYGGLYQRQYMYAGKFRMLPLDRITSVEVTATGNGYWMTLGDGHIAGFGDARNKGPVDIYPMNRGIELNVSEDFLHSWAEVTDYSFFKAIIYQIARDPDGSGFWYLAADGSVGHYDAEYWGKPGYHGMTGYRWHEGNFDGDISQIIKELLMWAGFTFYQSDYPSNQEPKVLGRVESTGIFTDTHITADRLDKKTIIDAINELAEVTGYYVYGTEEGGVNVASANMWRAGNMDENGLPIYVEDGTFDRVNETDPDAVPFIPIIHESADLLSYNASLSSTDKRTEIIVDTDLPDPRSPYRTQVTRFKPHYASEQVLPGVPAMRGMERPAIWVDNMFENEQERKLMAELIAIYSWFGQRQGTTSCVGNPLISLDDQVRLIERNTSETFIHRVTAIDHQIDLDSGQWTTDLTTHWLGDADNWALSATPQSGSSAYVRISEQLDSWQSYTNRGLGTGNAGLGVTNDLMTITGEFDSMTATSSTSPQWGTDVVEHMQIQFGESAAYGHFMTLGNGSKWPFMDRDSDPSTHDTGTTLEGSYLAVINQQLQPMVTLGDTPPEYQAVGGGPDVPANIQEYADRFIQIFDEYMNGTGHVIVGTGTDEIGYDSARYVEFFEFIYNEIKAYNPALMIAGPNVELRARSVGYDTSYNGVMIDSRDMNFLMSFINNVNDVDKIAIRINNNDVDAAALVQYIKSETALPLIVNITPDGLGAYSTLSTTATVDDIILWPSNQSLTLPTNYTGSRWTFEGNMLFTDTVSSLRLTLEGWSPGLGNGLLRVYDSDDNLIINQALPPLGSSIVLSNLGVAGAESQYRYVITGNAQSSGTANAHLSFAAPNRNTIDIRDSLVIVRG